MHMIFGNAFLKCYRHHVSLMFSNTRKWHEDVKTDTFVMIIWMNASCHYTLFQMFEYKINQLTIFEGLKTLSEIQLNSRSDCIIIYIKSCYSKATIFEIDIIFKCMLVLLSSVIAMSSELEVLVIFDTRL